jgi:hypothetical protein
MPEASLKKIPTGNASVKTGGRYTDGEKTLHGSAHPAETPPE